jgi:hypothetical protein
LKVIVFLLGKQLVYTKFCCILYEWDSNIRSSQYVVTEWPHHKQILPVQKNTENDPPADPQKIELPPIYIKLRLMKDSVKAMN